MPRRLKGLILALSLSAAITARADPVTITFDDVPLGGPQSGVGSNFTDDGFTFSPCHNYGIVDSSNMGLWTGFDEAPSGEWKGLNDSQFFVFQAGNGPGNPDYLGSMPGCGEPRSAVGSSLYITDGGGVFSLASLYGPMLGTFGVTSSKGGSAAVFFAPPSPGCQPQLDCFAQQLVKFDGPQWQDVTWIDFQMGFDQPAGFDQITFDVPEPWTTSLLMFGLGGVGLARRCLKRKHLRSGRW
jgi:hypothetical protein